jgi:hypothetical protein
VVHSCSRGRPCVTLGHSTAREPGDARPPDEATRGVRGAERGTQPRARRPRDPFDLSRTVPAFSTGCMTPSMPATTAGAPRRPTSSGPSAPSSSTRRPIPRTWGPTSRARRSARLLSRTARMLGVQMPWLDEIVRVKRPRHLRVALTQAESRPSCFRRHQGLASHAPRAVRCQQQEDSREGPAGSSSGRPGSQVPERRSRLGWQWVVSRHSLVGGPRHGRNVSTTMTYTPVLNRRAAGVGSPIDRVFLT